MHVSTRFSVAREKGAAALEFALAVSLFMTLFFALIDVGRLLYMQNTLTAATQEGARIIVAYPNLSTGELRTRMANAVVGISPEEMTVTVSHPSASTVEVRATYVYRAVTPIPFFDRITLRAATRIHY